MSEKKKGEEEEVNIGLNAFGKILVMMALLSIIGMGIYWVGYEAIGIVIAWSAVGIDAVAIIIVGGMRWKKSKEV